MTATAFAGEPLPETMIRDGIVFTIDRSAGGGPGTALPDVSAIHKAGYTVLGSDVGDRKFGHQHYQ